MSTIPQKYFAAANGFSGFRSYFESVFSSEVYERIFVLKGGPGTGKSSLMSKISSGLSSLCTSSELIYCSSDPHSLDGIILSRENKRVAILDGTSPHERDAIIPGAIDEIVNLGDGWNTEALQKMRSEILRLNKLKKENYKSAYQLLKQAGEVYGQIKSSLSLRIDFTKMNEFSKKLVNDLRLEPGTNTQKRRLITSFGKYGFYSIIDPKDSFEKRLTVSKYMGCEYFLMNFIYDTVKERTTDVTVLPSPLDDNMLDGFAFENSDIAILVGEPDTADICINEFMLPCTVIEKDYLNALNSYFVFLLDSAKDHFNAASIEHARLEEIYSSAMNFKTNDQKCNEIEQKIKDILKA